MKYDQRKTNSYRKARAIIIRSATHCAICGQPLDHAADPRSRWAPSADHIVPLSQGGGHGLANLRAVHYGCNSGRGDGVTVGRGSKRPKSRSVSATRASRAW